MNTPFDRSTFLTAADGLWVRRDNGSGTYLTEAEVKRLMRAGRVTYNHLLREYRFR